MAKVESLHPRQAWELIQAEPRCLFIDVRSHMEYLFIGHPVGAIHIPWIDEPDWKVNPDFVKEVRQLLLGGISLDGKGENVPVVLICRSGKRSLDAAGVLIADGFNRVYNVEEGFEGELDAQHHRSTSGGWRFEGLPWEQC